MLTRPCAAGQNINLDNGPSLKVSWVSTRFAKFHNIFENHHLYLSCYIITMAPGSIENTIEELKTKLIEQVLVVEDRVSLIQDLLKTQQNSREDINVPEVLFDDWSQDEVAGSENFSRGIIKTLRDTDKHAWEDLLKSCTSNQSDILSEFTAGKALEEIYQKFDFGSTRGTRQELGALESAEKVELPTTTEVSHTESLIADFKSLLTRHKQSDIGLYEDPGHKQPLLASRLFL